MEIKTMLQLIDKYKNDERITADNYAEFYGEKWVSVEDVLKEIEDIYSNFEFEKECDNHLLEIIKELQGEDWIKIDKELGDE